MKLDTSIIKDYLSGNCEYKNHWIFRSIDENGNYLFDCPSDEDKDTVQTALKDVLITLDGFNPYNSELFQRLFPKWREVCDTLNVVFAVGCPAPYDAMVREHNGEEFIIIDLIRLMSYGMEMKSLITPFFTHELSHICIHKDFPGMIEADDYRKKLENIVFDEGFAHLLSFRSNIEQVDFTPFIKDHYQKSCCKLREAICETDTSRQAACLADSNEGNYWDKYGAISGMLYLAMHIKEVEVIYEAGPERMIKNIAIEE